ncbi:hypothetical protein D3C72_1722590 [compost metagenome]
MKDRVTAIMRKEEPQEDVGQVVEKVVAGIGEKGLAVMLAPIRLRQGLRGIDDVGGIGGKMGVRRHAVALQRQPVGSEVTHLDDGDRDPVPPRHRGCDLMIGALLAKQDHVGHIAAADELLEIGRPVRQRSAVVEGAVAPPDDLVADVEVYPQAGVTVALEPVGDLAEDRR